MNRFKATTQSNIVKDSATGALLNTDMGGFAAVKAQRERFKQQQAESNRISQLENEIQELWRVVNELRGNK